MKQLEGESKELVNRIWSVFRLAPYYNMSGVQMHRCKDLVKNALVARDKIIEKYFEKISELEAKVQEAHGPPLGNGTCSGTYGGLLPYACSVCRTYHDYLHEKVK